MKIKKKTKYGELVSSSLVIDTYKVVKNGRRSVIRRLNGRWQKDATMIEAFESEVSRGAEWHHPNLLSYVTMFVDEDGPGVMMEGMNCISLEDYMEANPSFVTQTKEMERIIREVSEALAYLHARGEAHLNLSPCNVLLTKEELRVKLVNPLMDYPLKEVGLSAEIYIAPELMEAEDLDEVDIVKCDVYSLGRLIEYLYSLSSVPMVYKHAVRKAVTTDPKERVDSISSFRQAVSRGHILKKLCQVLGLGIVFVLVVWLLFVLTTSSTEEEIQFITPTATDVYVYDSISGTGSYISDSVAASNIEKLTREELEKQKKYEQKMVEIFRRRFRQKAIPVVEGIYSKQNMESKAGQFMSVSSRAASELQKLQEELSEEYKLDPIVTTKEAALVIEELTRETLKKNVNP